ncbi:hypothetical protein QUA04_24335, partial [Microcoleus sp. S13_C5]
MNQACYPSFPRCKINDDRNHKSAGSEGEIFRKPDYLGFAEYIDRVLLSLGYAIARSRVKCK